MNKDTKDTFGFQNVIEAIDQLDFTVKNKIQDDFNPNFEAKKEMSEPKCDLSEDKIIEKSNSAYCSLCQVRL